VIMFQTYISLFMICKILVIYYHVICLHTWVSADYTTVWSRLHWQS